MLMLWLSGNVNAPCQQKSVKDSQMTDIYLFEFFVKWSCVMCMHSKETVSVSVSVTISVALVFVSHHH